MGTDYSWRERHRLARQGAEAVGHCSHRQCRIRTVRLADSRGEHQPCAPPAELLDGGQCGADAGLVVEISP